MTSVTTPNPDTVSAADNDAIGKAMGEEILAERRAEQRRNVRNVWLLRLAVLVVVIGLWWLASDRGWSPVRCWASSPG